MADRVRPPAWGRPASVARVHPDAAFLVDIQPNLRRQLQRLRDGLRGLQRPKHRTAVEPVDAVAALDANTVAHIRFVRAAPQMLGDAPRLPLRRSR